MSVRREFFSFTDPQSGMERFIRFKHVTGIKETTPNGDDKRYHVYTTDGETYILSVDLLRSFLAAISRRSNPLPTNGAYPDDKTPTDHN